MMASNQAVANTVHSLAEGLVPHLDAIASIHNFESLKLLGAGVLEKLVAFESARIELVELNDELVDGRTGGHHRDRLMLFVAAASQADRPKLLLHEDNDFIHTIRNVVEDIKCFAVLLND